MTPRQSPRRARGREVAILVALAALACVRAPGPVLAAPDAAPAAPAPVATAPHAPSGLGAEALSELEKSQFIYISSTRKDGSLSKPAEIWFTVADGSVWVASSGKSWRAKRIRWGRPQAKIWIGKPNGPAFTASGEIVSDTKRQDQLCDAFGVKYASQWPKWEKSFRDGLRSGERVLIRYRPTP